MDKKDGGDRNMRRKTCLKNRILGGLTALALYGVFAGCGFVEQDFYGLGLAVMGISLAWILLFLQANEERLNTWE